MTFSGVNYAPIIASNSACQSANFCDQNKMSSAFIATFGHLYSESSYLNRGKLNTLIHYQKLG